MHNAQTYRDKIRIAGSQIRSLVHHLRDCEQHPDPATARSLRQALALLYEAAETLGIVVEDDQESRTLCAAA